MRLHERGERHAKSVLGSADCGLAGCLSTVTELGTSSGNGSTGVVGTGGTTGASSSTSGGSTTGGSTTGGSTTGTAAITLAQACNDYLAGGVVVETCVMQMHSLPSVQECEAVFAICTAQDVATLDSIGLCFKNLVCNASFASNFFACGEGFSTLSEPCLQAGESFDGGT